MDEQSRQSQRSPSVIWAGLFLLAAGLYLGGWLLGSGTGRSQEPTLPLLLAANAVRRLLWPGCVGLVILAGAASAGRRILHILRWELAAPVERVLFSLLLGLGVSAYATLGLGTLGLLRPAVFW